MSVPVTVRPKTLQLLNPGSRYHFLFHASMLCDELAGLDSCHDCFRTTGRIVIEQLQLEHTETRYTLESGGHGEDSGLR
jgi:hypothetical protein